jgi:hypothetical protein
LNAPGYLRFLFSLFSSVPALTCSAVSCLLFLLPSSPDDVKIVMDDDPLMPVKLGRLMMPMMLLLLLLLCIDIEINSALMYTDFRFRYSATAVADSLLLLILILKLILF